MRFKRPTFSVAYAEPLEDRRVLSANPLDLDLSSVPTQDFFSGDEIRFDLIELGAVINEGADGPRQVMWQLDPNADERPAGASISLDGTFQWSPGEDQEGLHEVRIIVVENGVPHHADVESLMIHIKSRKPDLDLDADTEGSDFKAVYHVGYGPVSPTGSEVVISDEDGETIHSATIELTNRPDGEAEILTVDTEGTNITATYEEGTLTLSGEDSHENYAKVLASLQYENTNPEADPENRIIEITINDGEFDSQTVTSTVVINHPPDLMAIPDQEVTLGSSHTVEISAVDPNAEDELVFLLEVGTPDFITLEHQSGSREATIHIDPPADLEMESIQVRVLVVDEHGLADVQTMDVNFVEAENTAPTISKIRNVMISQDGETGLIEFVVGDAETDPADLIVTATSNRPGLVSPEGIILGGEGENRTIQIIPNPGAFGAAQIRVTVSDGELTTTERFVTIIKKSHADPNTPPTIGEIDDVTVPQDGQSEPINLIIGDAETDPADLTVTFHSDNEAVVAADGIIMTGEGEERSIQIVPVAGAFGSATVTATVSDGELTASTSFVVTVTEVEANLPEAENDAYTVSADTALSITAEAGVLGNDESGDFGPLTVAEVNGEAEAVGEAITLDSGATLQLNADGSFEYDPQEAFADLPAGEIAVDSFTYTAVDQEGNLTTATVEVSVEGVVTVADPVANDDAYTVSADTALSITAEAGVLGNDESGDFGPLTVVEVNGEAEAVGEAITLDSGATLQLNADGSFEYDPQEAFVDLPAGEVAVDSFTYTAVDQEGNVTTATVEVSVEGVVTVADPVANDDAYTTDTDTVLTITATGLLSNDEGEGLVVVAVNGEATAVGSTVTLESGALLTLNENGSLTYDPNQMFGDVEPGEPATDTFEYTVADAFGTEASATVVLTIEAVVENGDSDLPPLNLVPESQATDSETSIEFTAEGGNAIAISDEVAGEGTVETTIAVDSGQLAFAGGFSSARHKLVGSVEQVNQLLDGLTYTPAAEFAGTVRFTITTTIEEDSGTGEPRTDVNHFLIIVSAAANGENGGDQDNGEDSSPESATDAVLASGEDLLADALWS